MTGWAVLCGLAGIPGVLPTPFFFLRAIEEKSRTLLLIGIAGAGCALVHLLTLYIHSSAGRQYASDPSVLVLPALLQSVIAPLFTAEFANGLAQAIRQHLPGIDGSLVGTVVLAGAIIATAVSASSRSAAGALTAYVAGLWALVTLIQDDEVREKLDARYEAMRRSLRQNTAEKAAAAVIPLLLRGRA